MDGKDEEIAECKRKLNSANNELKYVEDELEQCESYGGSGVGSSNPSSEILSFDDFEYIRSLLTNPEDSLKLLYRASRDGYSSYEFHNRCDNEGPTITVIKSDHGKVFGGFIS